MKKDTDSVLYERYLNALQEGKEPYFDADEVDDLLDELDESGDYTHYEEILSLGLRLHPDNLDLKIRNCHLLMDENKYLDVLAIVESLSETNNQDIDMLKLECFLMLERYDDFYNYLELLITNKVDYLESIFEFFVPILNEYDKEKDMLDIIEKGLSYYPSNRILNEEYCYKLENKGKIEDAVKICNMLIDMDPYSYDYWFTLGRLYSLSLQFDKAIEALDFAITCNDSESEVKILKGYCLYMNENYQKAIDVYLELQDDSNLRPRIHPFLAECYIKVDKYEEAYLLLKEVIRMEDIGDDSTAYANIILCCMETEREKEAEAYLQEAMQLFPENAQILSLQALFYLRKGRNDLAIQMTNLLHDILINRIESGKENNQNLYEAAQYLYQSGEVEKALEYYLQILKTEPDTPYIHINIAMAYLFMGDIDHFQKHCELSTKEEILLYLNQRKITFNKIKLIDNVFRTQISSDQLIQEYLKNKNNNN